MVERFEKVMKICLFGDSAVGKTCLIRRFVENVFDDKYIMTLGTKVTKKVLAVKHPDGKITDLILVIWDIMGQKGFRKLLQDAYFDGAKGGIGVCDVTRQDTLEGLEEWIESVYNITGRIPLVLLANKCDLKDLFTVDENDLKALSTKYNVPYMYTSAKTGENVDNAFKKLADQLVFGSR
jgi:small GTP-binding protein